MEKKIIDPKTIAGWGMDANPDDQPNFPMKFYTGDDHERKNWERPTLQEDKVDILKSTERPGLSAVFGTPNPPRFLSGMIRKYAFRYSENMYRHWIPLLIADRIDMLESTITDLASGHAPNIAKEMGWKALYEKDKSKLIKSVAPRIVILIGVLAYLKLRKRK